jgi:hypothetical protein
VPWFDHGMARSSTRNVKPSLSDAPRDKLAAALNWACAKGSEGYDRAPMYFDACREWYQGLTLDQVELVSTVVTIYTASPHAYGGEPVALDHAQGLPPAPRCPL